MLSPCLFAIYTDGLVKKVQSCGYGCYVRHTCVSILLYADDILLLAPSVSALQLLVSVCEELKWLDIFHKCQKSAFLHIGPRYNAKCKCITTSSGGEISWLTPYDILECTLHSQQVLMLNLRRQEIVLSRVQLYLW